MMLIGRHSICLNANFAIKSLAKTVFYNFQSNVL